MAVYGLTGGIASGKSCVSRRLAELGAIIIDADKISHEIMRFDRGAARSYSQTKASWSCSIR